MNIIPAKVDLQYALHNKPNTTRPTPFTLWEIREEIKNEMRKIEKELRKEYRDVFGKDYEKELTGDFLFEEFADNPDVKEYRRLMRILWTVGDCNIPAFQTIKVACNWKDCGYHESVFLLERKKIGRGVEWIAPFANFPTGLGLLETFPPHKDGQGFEISYQIGTTGREWVYLNEADSYTLEYQILCPKHTERALGLDMLKKYPSYTRIWRTSSYEVNHLIEKGDPRVVLK